jgi:hypothetical protein
VFKQAGTLGQFSVLDWIATQNGDSLAPIPFKIVTRVA